MNSLIAQLLSLKEKEVHILDYDLRIASYIPLDLSYNNPDLKGLDIKEVQQCQDYIDEILAKNNAKVAYGGYLEKRNLYNDTSSFSNQGKHRNIHLGIDFWAPAETKVITPLDGQVHSFQNNTTSGDYGPTIILQHKIQNLNFHTLYGHLSIQSLDGLYIGKQFDKGDVLGYLGTSDINVNYAPHLHFQIIEDLQGNFGDYPGVCSQDMLPYYSKNCPNPDILLKM